MVNELATPAFLVDKATVQRNCDRMRAKALRSGVAFRPHVKTHKTIEIARMQHGGTPAGSISGPIGPVTVSTLAEAEAFAAAGFQDITYAVPIAPQKLARASALARRVERLNVVVDSEAALHAIEAYHRGYGGTFDVFLKVDCGYHRSGVDPADPDSLELALALAASPSIHFQGLLTHAGHSYNARSLDEIRRIAAEETSELSRFRALAPELAEVTRSIGSTPTASVVDRFDDCDEVRPGNYVFYDAFQATLGTCSPADCAVSVLTTVVGSYPARQNLIVDAGALALSKDTGPDHIAPGFGYGIVCDTDLNPLPLKLIALSQEHGKLEGDLHLPVGTRLRIIPNHSCLTAAMYDTYYALESGRVAGEWRPVRGW